MKLNTALGFLGLGGALAVVGWTSPGEDRRRWPVSLLAWLPLVVGGLTLVEYLAGIDLGIDQLLVADPGGGDHPGRMSPATATCFTLGAVAWLARLSQLARAAVVFAGLGLALLPVAVYVYDPGGLAPVAPHASMAAHTSVGFLLSFIGMALCAPLAPAKRLIADSPGGAFLRRNVVLLACLPLAAGAVAQGAQHLDLFPRTFGLAFAATLSSMLVIALLFWAAREFDARASRLDVERRAAEDARRVLEAVLGITADVIIHIDTDGKILQTNAGVKRMFGWDREELVGEHFNVMMPAGARPQHDAYFRDFAAGADGSQINLGSRMNGLHRDGRELALETTIVKSTVAGVPHLTVSLRDRTEERRAEENLREAAHTDPLTGVGNRRAFELAAARAFRAADAAPASGAPAILILDLDHFKRINDEYGHPAGDAVLRQFAATCSTVLRSDDRLYRVGGEEFALVLTAAADQAAVLLAERLRTLVGSRRFELPDGRAVSLTCSMGVAKRRGSEAVADTLERADGALYGAKAAGRDRVGRPDD
jgi:diguanylate cyclase (GGDEF)-like protein/PAS domain S-box-containing protein